MSLGLGDTSDRGARGILRLVLPAAVVASSTAAAGQPMSAANAVVLPATAAAHTFAVSLRSVATTNWRASPLSQGPRASGDVLGALACKSRRMAVEGKARRWVGLTFVAS